MWGATSASMVSHADGKHFNPRAPCGARPKPSFEERFCRYFNPRAPCGARHDLTGYTAKPSFISIHAPRVGRDQHRRDVIAVSIISIHAPRVGRDCKRFLQSPESKIFQSTRPVWGATGRRAGRERRKRHFNPRAPCGARRLLCSIAHMALPFQSTRPVWGATGTLAEKS